MLNYFVIGIIFAINLFVIKIIYYCFKKIGYYSEKSKFCILFCFYFDE